MTKKNQIYALAGLLADPLLADQRDQFVPAQWLDDVKQAQSTAALAGKLTAGASKEASKGKMDIPLQSVFSNIDTKEGKIPARVYWPQSPLALEEDTVIPKPTVKLSKEPWNKFIEEARALKSAYDGASDDKLPLFIESLLLLLQHYAWCLPSSYSDLLPDVSLYDHSRMTAALSAAMVDHKEGDSLAQLVGGDLSGVQKFIYTITARGATSALRGRSFYLQLLTEVVARYLLRKLGLPATSMIYAGGGNFYLMVPTNADLQPLREYISRILLYHHSGDLYLAIDKVDLHEKDFYNGEITNRWQDLADGLNRTKLQTFAELDESFKAVFAPLGHGGNEELQCQVCGLEHPETSREEPRKCPPCISYEDLGKDLRNARYLLYDEIEETNLPAGEPVPRKWHEVLAHFGWRATPSNTVPKANSSKSTLFALSNDALKDIKPSTSQAVGRRLLVNVTPTITNDEIEQLRGRVDELPKRESVKPYDAMEYQSQGIKRIGVMRMDVDNLSTIIKSGFGKKATLARIGALSFAISLFFEGWVAKLAEDINDKDMQEGRGERLYSIYSGGDDLFFVGSWDAVIELTCKIRTHLSRYAGEHPGVHASAGIVLVGGKYPLYQAAQDAGQAEEEAKEHEWFTADERHHTKDSVTFLGQTMPWSQFGVQDSDVNQRTVSAWAHLLERELQKESSSRALLGLLIRMQGMYDAAAEKRRRQGVDLNLERKVQSLWGAWNWLSPYYLKRMQKRSRDDAFKKMLDDILKLFQNQFGSIEWIGLAARWAELKLRK